MHFPKLTPLQSRLAACLGTSILLLLIWLSLNPRHFAYASELNSDHNHHRIALHYQELEVALLDDIDDVERTEQEYAADFQLGLGRSLVGRQVPLDIVSLKNNLPNTLNLVDGETQSYIFPSTELSADSGSRGVILPTNVTGQDANVSNNAKRKRDIAGEQQVDVELKKKRQNTGKTVYVSANTCLQPNLNANKTGTPGQPTIYYSLESNNQRPGKGRNDGFVQMVQGYAALQIQNVVADLFISIEAPTLPNDTFTGPWSYQIAASTDDYYHYYDNTTSFLYTVDTDSNSALLATYNLTADANDTTTLAQRQQWMDMSQNPPFDIYVFNSSSPKIDGIKHSYCGLSKLNMDFMRVNTSISDRGVGGNPKQQFYFQSLFPGNNYFSVLAYKGANTTAGAENTPTIAGGGQVWKSMQFSTKRDNNCKVIFDLPFCTAVAYAVPTNPENSTFNNATNLALLYDNNAQQLYQNFSYSLQQIPCNTTSTAQYSLTSTCEDCARDYKTWLCAVTIPRCVDFSNTESFLAPRNLGSPFPNGSTPSLELLQASLPSDVAVSVKNFTQLPANSSRNPLIDSAIAPGPYKELLPCHQLCWDMVRTCPMSLGLRCPVENALYGRLGMSYGTFDPAKILGEGGVANFSGLSCNYLGVDWPTLGSGGVVVNVGRMWWAMLVVVCLWNLL